jgi:methionine-rich copper-binding protein CopC
VRSWAAAGIVVLVSAVIVVGGSAAHAHVTLVSSTPADSAQLDTPPAIVELVFSEPVDPRLVTVVVSSADGAQWQDGAPVVSEAVVAQAVRPLANAGGYTVGYRVVSSDGHPVTGELGFSVAAPVSTPPASSPTAAAGANSTPAARSRPADDGTSGSTVWRYAAIGLPVAALLFAGGMGLARARSRGSRRGHGS